jgi:hypothetical protein
LHKRLIGKSLEQQRRKLAKVSDTLTMMTQIGVYSSGRLLGLWFASFKVWIAAVIGFALGFALFLRL